MSKQKLLRKKRVAESQQNWREVATICNALGSELQGKEDYQGALEEHLQEKEACTKLGDTLGIAVAHRRIGEVLCELGEEEKALDHQQQYLLLAVQADSVLEQQRAYATLGRTYLSKAERTIDKTEKGAAISDASSNFLKALNKCKELPSNAVSQVELAQMRCRLYLNLGLVADQKGDSTKAIGLISQSSTLARQHTLHEDLYRCYSNLCLLYTRQQKYKLALEEAKLATTVAIKLDNSAKAESQQCLGRLYLLTGNFVHSKKAMTASCKGLQADKCEPSRIWEMKRIVKATGRLCLLEKIDIGDLLEDELMKHHENMADCYAQLKCPEKAIEYYKKSLEDAAIIGKIPIELAAIYYSIAKCYEENLQFKKARDYYKREYDIRVDKEPKEACQTLLAIASVAEQMKEPFLEVEKLYESALDLAINSNNPKLQVHILRLLCEFKELTQKRKDGLETRINSIIESHDLDTDCRLTDESDAESDVTLSDSEDASDDEVSNRPCNTLKVKNDGKVNEFGETKLHIASKNGDLKEVKRLVKNGLSINTRDTAGWLPLHEACNRGHADVVEFLLSKGAPIDDRGKKFSGGITPIHDSASNGFTDTVRLLIRKGASVIVKTDAGETPLGCLIGYRKRSTLTDEKTRDILLLEEELSECMKRAGCDVKFLDIQKQSNKKVLSSPNNSDYNKTFPGSSNSRRNIIDPVSEEDSSSDELPSLLPSPIRKKKNAVVSYRSAITCLGSAVSRGSLDILPQLSSTQKTAKTGLIEAEEFVGENDFFENDMLETSRKRKRTQSKSVLEFTNFRKERKTAYSSDINSNNKKSAPHRTRQTKLTTILDRVPSPIQSEANIDGLDLGEAVFITSDNVAFAGDPITNVAQNTTVVSTSRGSVGETQAPKNSNVPSINAIPSGPLRLRVRVEDKTLLVPIAEASRGLSIEWLCGEVSRRYYQLAGIRPDINLRTSDGAILHSSDPITLVLGQDQEELVACVTSWQLPPLQHRYTHDCLHYQQVPCPRITAALTAAESSCQLQLQKACRGAAQQRLVIRALQRHQSLHTVSLGYNTLADEGFSLLLGTLPSLTGLATLDLRATGITKKALMEWTDQIDSQLFSKSPLNNINISYNTLLGCTLSNIVRLLSLPNIVSLDLSHCSLDIQQMAPTTSNSSVQLLKLDYNTFNVSPLKQLLSNVPLVKHLSVAGVRCCSDGSDSIATALCNLLGGGEECPLEYLDLSQCQLTPIELDTIRAYVYRCPGLSHLSLAHNKNLTSTAVIAMLKELQLNFSVPLTSLQLHGIPNEEGSSGLTEALVQMLQRKFHLHKPLQTLSCRSCDSSNLLIDMWVSLFNTQSRINRVGKEVFLSLIN